MAGKHLRDGQPQGWGRKIVKRLISQADRGVTAEPQPLTTHEDKAMDDESPAISFTSHSSLAEVPGKRHNTHADKELHCLDRIAVLEKLKKGSAKVIPQHHQPRLMVELP